MQLRCMCPRTAPGGSERSLTARQRVGSALEVLRCRLRAMPMARCYHAVALARYGQNEPLWRARPRAGVLGSTEGACNEYNALAT
jgi:hypothetical protein